MLASAADAVLDHLVERGLVEDRLLDSRGGAAHVAAGVRPVGGARLVVADLLRVEVGPLLLDFLEVQPHLQEHLLRDDRGQASGRTSRSRGPQARSCGTSRPGPSSTWTS